MTTTYADRSHISASPSQIKIHVRARNRLDVESRNSFQRDPSRAVRESDAKSNARGQRAKGASSKMTYMKKTHAAARKRQTYEERKPIIDRVTLELADEFVVRAQRRGWLTLAEVDAPAKEILARFPKSSIKRLTFEYGVRWPDDLKGVGVRLPSNVAASRFQLTCRIVGWHRYTIPGIGSGWGSSASWSGPRWEVALIQFRQALEERAAWDSYLQERARQ